MISEDVLLSVEEKGFLAVWNITTNKIINSEILKFNPTCCVLYPNKDYFALGSKQGTLRIYSLNGTMAKDAIEISAVRFNEEQSIQMIKICSQTKQICVKFMNVNKLYFCSFNDKTREIEHHGYLPLDFEIKDVEWVGNEENPSLLVLLKKGMVLSIPIKYTKQPDKEFLSNLSNNLSQALIRRIDPDSEKFFLKSKNDFFYSFGSNLVLQKYKLPSESITKLDLKTKQAGNPLEEYVAFNFTPQAIIAHGDKILYATENGEIGSYDVKSDTFITHQLTSFVKGGASFIGMSNEENLIVCGVDGSLFIIEKIDEYFTSQNPNRQNMFKEVEILKKSSNPSVEKTISKNSDSDSKSPVQLNQNSHSSKEQTAKNTDLGLNIDNSNEKSNEQEPLSSSRMKKSPNQVAEGDPTEQELSGENKKKSGEQKSNQTSPRDMILSNLNYKEVVTTQIQHVYDESVLDINSKMYQNHLLAIKIEKDTHYNQTTCMLRNYQEEYKIVCQQNQSLNEEFRLKSEELCIDIEKQLGYKLLAQEITHEIREYAKKETIFYKILHQKIKNNTYQKMDIHLKGISGFIDKIGFFNFPICKQSPIQNKRLNRLILLRNMELREQFWHKEHQTNLLSAMDNCDNIIDVKNPDFVVNGKHGKQKMVLMDFEQRERELKEYEEEKRKKREMLQNASNSNAIRRIELVNRRKKKKKNTLKGFAKQTIENKPILQDNQIQTKNGRVSIHETVKPFSLLYSTLELTTRNKKISQIYFIKNIIKVIKEEFNVDFDNLFKIREKKLDLINEYRKKIGEICIELQIPEQQIDLAQNIIEKSFKKSKKHIRIKTRGGFF